MELMTDCGECQHHCSVSISTANLFQTLAITVIVTGVFVVSKSSYDQLRQAWSRATVVVIGAGPVGLISVFIAARSSKVTRIILYEEKCRHDLLNRPQQIALDPDSVQFLATLGVDFDNIEGCWEEGRFFTRTGVFQEYMLSILHQLQIPVDVRLKTKFTRESLKELDGIVGRLVAVVCDGACGRAASLLGLNDELIQHSCRAYGAVSALERGSTCSVPTPETRVHNLTFDLDAYQNHFAPVQYAAETRGCGGGGGGRGQELCTGWPLPRAPVHHRSITRGQSSPGYGMEDIRPLLNQQGFHLKIFGNPRHRYLALAVPRGESKLVRTLKVVLDQSVMRNIFQVCFNTYKCDDEEEVSDTEAIRYMKFSPRLFEIKLLQRMENVAYVEDANIFVVAEGEAARRCNFSSGLDVNLGVRGLTSLEHFIDLAACAESEKTILNALHYKLTHARSVVQDYLKRGLRDTMYT